MNTINRRLLKVEAQAFPPAPMEWQRVILTEAENTPERRAEILANGKATIFRVIVG